MALALGFFLNGFSILCGSKRDLLSSPKEIYLLTFTFLLHALICTNPRKLLTCTHKAIGPKGWKPHHICSELLHIQHLKDFDDTEVFMLLSCVKFRNRASTRIPAGQTVTSMLIKRTQLKPTRVCARQTGKCVFSYLDKMLPAEVSLGLAT